jgi:hypothetical protein
VMPRAGHDAHGKVMERFNVIGVNGHPIPLQVWARNWLFTGLGGIDLPQCDCSGAGTYDASFSCPLIKAHADFRQEVMRAREARTRDADSAESNGVALGNWAANEFLRVGLAYIAHGGSKGRKRGFCWAERLRTLAWKPTLLDRS